MEIIEIWVPELVVVLFLALQLLRPFAKGLWPLDGLIWLPPMALGIMIGIFPAYGFRPECLPMLVFAIVYNSATFFSVVSSITSSPDDSFRDRGPFLTVCLLLLLTVVAVPMFVFASKVDHIRKIQTFQSVIVDEEPEEQPNLVEVLKLSNRIVDSAGIFDRDYTLRVYGAVQANRPLVFLVPPEMGSAASIDLVCTELQKKHFTVVTYSYQDHDLFRQYSIFRSTKLLTYWRTFRRATDLVSANEQGKTLEAGRRTEIEFLLSKIPALLGYTDTNLPPFLLVGYGAGGSALAYLADESDFTSLYSNVRGVVAVESHLWSAYVPEPPVVRRVIFRQGVISRQLSGIVNFFERMEPQRVSRKGPLPGVKLLGDGLPVLYLVSDRALDSPKGQKPYRAVLDTLRSGAGPVAFAVLEGAGPLDYQDYPFTHPIYSFFLPGLNGANKSNDPIGDTASIIGNFASLLLEQAEIDAPPRHAISGSLYVESKGLPGFRL